MYKLLFFLKKTNHEQIQNHFIEYTIKYISAVVHQDIKIGKVESSLLLDSNYSLFCEAKVESKDTWDSLMNTVEGKELNKDLMEFHNSISVVFIDYNF